MKKIISILMSVAALAVATVFTGCSEELTDVLAPADTWCRFTMSNTDSEGNLSEAYVYMYYSDTTKTITGGKKDYEVGGGLTVVVAGYSDNRFMGMTNTSFAMKTFDKDKDISFDDDDTGTADASAIANKIGKMNRTNWAILYNLAKAKSGDKFEKLSGAPAQLTEKAYTQAEWETIKTSFSWKTVLANYLLQ